MDWPIFLQWANQLTLLVTIYYLNRKKGLSEADTRLMSILKDTQDALEVRNKQLSDENAEMKELIKKNNDLINEQIRELAALAKLVAKPTTHPVRKTNA